MPDVGFFEELPQYLGREDRILTYSGLEAQVNSQFFLFLGLVLKSYSWGDEEPMLGGGYQHRFFVRNPPTTIA